MPLMRAFVFEYPEDPDAENVKDEYLLGRIFAAGYGRRKWENGLFPGE